MYPLNSISVLWPRMEALEIRPILWTVARLHHWNRISVHWPGSKIYNHWGKIDYKNDMLVLINLLHFSLDLSFIHSPACHSGWHCRSGSHGHRGCHPLRSPPLDRWTLGRGHWQSPIPVVQRALPHGCCCHVCGPPWEHQYCKVIGMKCDYFFPTMILWRMPILKMYASFLAKTDMASL